MVSASTFQNRQCNRVPISLKVIGKIMSNLFQRHSFTGKSLNVSYDGICFETSVNGLKVGQEIKLKTFLYEGDFRFRAKGNIRWINPNYDLPGSIKIGIKLFKTSHYYSWCRRIDTALSVTRLHDIHPISCYIDPVLQLPAWETIYGPVEFKGKGFGKNDYVKTIEFGNNFLSGDKVIIKGENFEVFKSGAWIKYEGIDEITHKSNATSGYIGVKANKGQVITVEVKRLRDLPGI